jgi:hypothetical protein
MYAANVRVIIEPWGGNDANGKITANIKGLSPLVKDRLILLSFHIQMKPNIPSNDTVPLFKGWYFVGEKKQLWIGDILKANHSDLNFSIDLPSIMHKNSTDLYELNISINNNEGLHTFLPDSTERTIIIPINQIIFKNSKDGKSEYKIENKSGNWESNKKSNELEFSCKTGNSADLFVVCSIKEPQFMWILLIIVPLFIIIAVSILLKKLLKDKKTKLLPLIIIICGVLVILFLWYFAVYKLIYPFSIQSTFFIGVFSSLFSSIIISLTKIQND